MVPEFVRIFLPFFIHIPLLGFGIKFAFEQTHQSPLRRFFWTGIGFKLLAGTILGILYLYYYPYQGDTWVLFDESALLGKLAFRDPSAYLRTLLLQDVAHAQHYVVLTLAEQPRAFFMAKLLSVINLFTFNNYWITGWYCSLFAFWGLWRFANALVIRLAAHPMVAAIACLLLPSVVFWSSGVLKETIAVGCIGYLLSLLLSYPLKSRQIWHSAGCVASLWILWQIKFYYLGTLLPVCAAWIASNAISRLLPHSPLSSLRWIHLLLCAGMFHLLPIAYELLTSQSFLASLIANHDATVRVSQPGSFVVFSSLQPTLLRFLQYFPLALWSGWFAPLPWQAQNALALAAGLENLFLLVCFLACISAFLRKSVGFGLQKDTIFKTMFRQSMWLYCISLSVILAIASPNYGALVRYKVGFLPVLAFLLLDTLATVYESNTTKPKTE